MSTITFDASLNTEKLDQAIKASNQTVKQWSDGIVKAGNQADQGLGKMTKSFKQAIADQKILIKSIEEDVKKLQKAYDDATAGKAKSAMGEQVGMAKRSLSEEKAQLAKLQQQAIEGNKQEDNSQQSLIKSLSRWAAGIFTVTAAMKIGKAIIASTEDTMHSFERITAAVTSGVGYFFKAIASGDWTNFSAGMDRAIRGAIEYVDAMERLANRENEQRIKSSEADIRIAELRDKTFDKDKEHTGERFAALQKIIEEEKTKYTEEAALAKSAYDINLKKAASDSGLSEKQIKNFLREYSSLEKLIEVGEKYNEITKLTRTPGLNAGYLADLYKERDALAGNAAEAGAYVTQIGKITSEVRKQLSEAAAAANEATAAYGQKNRRDKMQAAEAWNTLWDAWMSEIDAQNKIWEERNDIGKKIAEQEKLLNDAIAEGSDSEIKAIGLRIAALQEELKVREKLTKSIVDAMQFEGFVPTGAQTGQLSMPTVFPKIKKAPGSKTPEQINQEMVNLGGSSAKWAEAMKEIIAKNTQKNLDKELETRNKILSSVSSLVMQLGQASGMDEKTLASLGTSLNIFTSALSGDWVGTVSSVLSNLISLIPNEAAKFQNQIDAINLSLKEQQRLIEQSSRTGGGTEAREKYIQGLEDKEKEIYRAINYAAGQGKPTTALLESLVDLQGTIQDAKQDLDDFLRGGITENTLADSIAQGFRDGKTSVDDFAGYLNTELTDAITNIFTQQLLNSPQMKVFAADLKTFMEDQVLTPEEVAKLKLDQLAVVNANKVNWDALTQGLDLGGNVAQSSMVGTLQRSITEETGTEWVGLARRQADDLRQMKDYSKIGINHLVGIEANTYNTVAELQRLNAKTDIVISNTKPLYAGAL